MSASVARKQKRRIVEDCSAFETQSMMTDILCGVVCFKTVAPPGLHLARGVVNRVESTGSSESVKPSRFQPAKTRYAQASWM
jgi:hypothetical protein